MKKERDKAARAAEMRRCAESRLKGKKKGESTGPLTAEDTQRLVQELQIHQIELEMQNEELQRSRAEVETLLGQYSDLYDFAPTGYLTLDCDGTIRQVNLTGARLLGLDRSRLINRRFGLFVSDDSRPAFNVFLKSMFERQAEASCKVILLKDEGRDHQPFWAHIVAAAVEGKTGCETTTLCRIAITDVTAGKLAEIRLREAEELARATLDGLASHIAIVDEKGTILAVNEAWRSFAAANPPLAVNVCEGADYLAVCDRATGGSSDGAAEFAHGIRDVLAGLHNDFQMEYSCHSTNEQRWFIGHVTRFPSQGPRRAVIAHENITARKQIETQLENHLAFISMLIESVPIPLFYKDTSGVYRGCNAAFVEFFGVKRGNVVGHTAYHIAPSDLADVYHQMDEALLSQGPGRVQVYESIAKRADGMNREVVFSKATYADSDGRVAGLIGIIQDVTDLKQVHRKLRERETELAHVARVAAMGQMVATIAHEINQPLDAISNYATGAIIRLKAGGADTELLVDAMERSAAQAQRASTIIRRLRRMIHKHGVRSSVMSLNEAVRNAVALLEHDLHEGGFDLQLELSEALPQVVADSIQIEQVVINLVRNAMESLAGTPTGERRITISTRLNDSHSVEVSVQDSGIVLGDEDLDRIFDAFVTTKEDGLGMGLAICRFLIEAYGGRIWAEAGSPQGAAFLFTLPPFSKDGGQD